MVSVFCNKFGLCFLAIIFSVLCIFGAVVLFIEADDIYEWAKGFNIKGQCILDKRTDEVGEVAIVVEYYWNIYNMSSCNKDGSYDIYSQQNVDYDTPDDEIYEYEIGHIEPCYTNEACDDVVLDKKDGGESLSLMQDGGNYSEVLLLLVVASLYVDMLYYLKANKFKTWYNSRDNQNTLT
eukprot:915692_1